MVKKAGDANQNIKNYGELSNDQSFNELARLHTSLDTKLGKVIFWGKKKDQDVEIDKIYAKVDKGKIVFGKKGFFSRLFNTKTMDKETAEALVKLFEKTTKLNLHTSGIDQATLDKISQLALKITKIAVNTLGQLDESSNKQLQQGLHKQQIQTLQRTLTESAANTLGAQLCIACEAADSTKVDELLKLIEKNPDSKKDALNYTDKNGNTPLHLVCSKINSYDPDAIRKNNARFELLKKLISEGADPNIKNKSDSTPLSIANEHGNYALASALLHCKNLKIEYSDQKSVDAIKNLFNVACSNHNLADVTRIIELVKYDNRLKTAILNHKDKNGNTPLHHVCQLDKNDTDTARSDKLKILQMLANEGANSNLQNNEGLTPFCLTTTNKDIISAKILLMSRNFNIDKSDDNSIEAIRYLLYTVCKNSAVNLEGKQVDNQQVVGRIIELLKNDQDLKDSILNHKYKYDLTPLKHAIERECSPVIIQLLINESNISDRDLNKLIKDFEGACQKRGIKNIDLNKSSLNDDYDVKILKMLLEYQSTKEKRQPVEIKKSKETPDETPKEREDRIKLEHNIEKFVNALRKEYVGNNKNLPNNDQKRIMKRDIKIAMGFDGTDVEFRRIVKKAALFLHLHPDKTDQKYQEEQSAPTKKVKRAADELREAEKTGDNLKIEEATKILQEAKLALEAKAILDQKVQLALIAQEALVENIKNGPEKNVIVAKKALQKAIANNEPDEVQDALNKNLQRAQEVNDVNEFYKFFNEFLEPTKSKVAPSKAQIEKTESETRKEEADKIANEKIGNLFRVATGHLDDEAQERIREPLQMLIKCFVQNGEKSTINQDKIAGIKSAILGNNNNPKLLIKEIYNMLDPEKSIVLDKGDTNYSKFENMRMFLTMLFPDYKINNF